jgi:hypothetical protein
LRVGGLNDYGRLSFNRGGLCLLLRVGLKLAGLLGLHSHALYRCHHIGLLCQEGVAQHGGPVETLIHHLEHCGKRHEGLNAWIPVLSSRCLHECLALKIAVLLHPPVRCNNLQGVRRSRQNLSYQRIRVQRDGSYQAVQLVRAHELRLLIGRRLPLCRRLRVEELLSRRNRHGADQ